MDTLEIIGRSVMKFGASSFLDKLEDHFGAALSSALARLVGLTFIAVILDRVFGF